MVPGDNRAEARTRHRSEHVHINATYTMQTLLIQLDGDQTVTIWSQEGPFVSGIGNLNLKTDTCSFPASNVYDEFDGKECTLTILGCQIKASFQSGYSPTRIFIAIHHG